MTYYIVIKWLLLKFFKETHETTTHVTLADSILMSDV